MSSVVLKLVHMYAYQEEMSEKLRSWRKLAQKHIKLLLFCAKL